MKRRDFLGSVVAAFPVVAAMNEMVKAETPAVEDNQFRERLTAYMNAKPKEHRRGYFEISNEMARAMLPPDTSFDFFNGVSNIEGQETVWYEWWEKALLLPSNTRIVGISPHWAFRRGMLAFLVECPDFQTVPEAAEYPYIAPIYGTDGDDGLIKFIAWGGWDLAWNGGGAITPNELRALRGLKPWDKPLDAGLLTTPLQGSVQG